MNHERIKEIVREGCKRARCSVDWYRFDDEDHMVTFQAGNEAGDVATFQEWNLNTLSEIMIARRVYRGCMHYLQRTPYHHVQPFGSL